MRITLKEILHLFNGKEAKLRIRKIRYNDENTDIVFEGSVEELDKREDLLSLTVSSINFLYVDDNIIPIWVWDQKMSMLFLG